jgi:two-component system cell cycle response regulator DivK
MSDSINFNFDNPEAGQNSEDAQNSGNTEYISEGLAAELSAAATPEANDVAGPLATLLRTIGAPLHATVKPDARLEPSNLVASASAAASLAAASADAAPKTEERRRRRRALISAPVRVRGVDVTNGGPDEVSTTVDVSRIGLLFVSSLDCYSRAMEVMVTFPYSKAPHALHAEQAGRVMRVHQREDGRYAVAIALGLGVGEDLVDSCGRKLTDDSAKVVQPAMQAVQSNKPVVLAVDADPALRASLKCYLQNEGYEVMAVSSSDEALEVLKMHTPALVIAEVEGENFPGFNICGHVKSTPRLQHIPVVLITRSAYPSDYANAHSIGAVVCMAKPFKQERLGHVVRLLAPLPKHAAAKLSAPAGDPTRRHTNGGAKPNANGHRNGNGNGHGSNGNSNGNANGNGKRFQFRRFGKN